MMAALIGLLAAFVGCPAGAVERLPLESFAHLEAISDAAISPDGRYVVVTTSRDQKRLSLVLDRAAGLKPVSILQPDKDDDFDVDWCGWVGNHRILCSYRKTEVNAGYAYPVTRLAAADADASNPKTLISKTEFGTTNVQSNVIDWNPGIEDTVLVQARKSYEYGVYPAVYALNVRTGAMQLNTRARAPIRQFISDGHGQVRLGFGVDHDKYVYMGRLDNQREWQVLARFEPFSSTDNVLTPFAVADRSNVLYAGGYSDGRGAIWTLDLEDKRDPSVVFSHPAVDVSLPIFARDGRLIGFKYHTEEPHAYYTDPKFREAAASLNQSLPHTFNEFVDMTLDQRTFLVRSYSDVEAGRWWVFDADKATLQSLGRERPELPPEKMSPMRWIHYTAADGTSIPGYLTVPLGKRPEMLPLIVMPHGGPIARDTFSFDFLAQFLASRGYAVLQMNFRGSSGYGYRWLHDAHQDWGGLTYADITDAARWSISQKIADPKRVCILGWGFGGYAALLGAVRNSDLYRCSVSIAGISDLNQLEFEQGALAYSEIARAQIGTDWEKLKRDSPRRHADEINSPVLLVHGDRDYNTLPRHSKEMAAALEKAGKKYRYVSIKGGNHSLWREADRITVLQSVETFLAENLGAP